MDRRASSAKTSLIILHLAHAHTENRSGGREGLEEEGKREKNNSAEAVQVVGRSKEKKKDRERKMKKKGQREEEERDKERDTR